MFFERLPNNAQQISKHNSVSQFWDTVAEAVGEIPRVSEFEIVTDDTEWSDRLKAFEQRCSRRESFDARFMLLDKSKDDQSFIGRFKEWASSIRKLDPRYQILSFFDQVAQEGDQAACEQSSIDDFLNKRPLLWYLPTRASVFTVWRPTSRDAIRRMMSGEAVGKGLDIKGKSAKVRYFMCWCLKHSFPPTYSTLHREGSSLVTFLFCRFQQTRTKRTSKASARKEPSASSIQRSLEEPGTWRWKSWRW